jgi:hypothetical protein
MNWFIISSKSISLYVKQSFLSSALSCNLRPKKDYFSFVLSKFRLSAILSAIASGEGGSKVESSSGKTKTGIQGLYSSA